MSKRNYSQYSNKINKTDETKEIVEEVVVTEPVVEETAAPEVVMAEETVETVSLPETVTGVVTGCAKLNVRKNPSVNADVVCVLDVTSEIEINVAKSNKDWFSVCTATGIEGYCMRKFVEASL